MTLDKKIEEEIINEIQNRYAKLTISETVKNKMKPTIFITLLSTVLSINFYIYMDYIKELIPQTVGLYEGKVTLFDILFSTFYIAVLSILPTVIIGYLQKNSLEKRFNIFWIFGLYTFCWIGISFMIVLGYIQNFGHTWLNYEVLFFMLAQKHFYIAYTLSLIPMTFVIYQNEKHCYLSIRNILGMFLVGLGIYLVLYFIGVTNNIARMTHAMEIVTIGVVSFIAVPLGLFLLYLGRKLITFSLHWVFRVLFFFSSVVVMLNVWFYSYVPFELKMSNSDMIYPSLEEDIFAFTMLGILLLFSFKKRKLDEKS